MRICQLTLILLCVALQSVHAVEIALWQTFAQKLESSRDGQAEVLSALRLIEEQTPEANNAAIKEALESAKDKGHPCAYYLLGIRERDPDKRIELFRQAFQRGVLAAIYGLADALYRHGQGDEADFPEALALFERANQWPTKDSLFYLGRMHHLGHGTEVDAAKAKHYLEIAAKDGHARALFNLGWIYESGKIGVPDLRTAISYYRKAAAHDHAQAVNNLAWSLWTLDGVESMPEAEPLFREAVAKGNTDAMTNFGYLNLYKKWPGANSEYGLQLTLQAAENDSRQAIENLHYFYEGWGELTTPDPEKADHWHQRLRELD